MHSIAEIGTNVPAFLGKLWKMVEDPVSNDLITWSSAGDSFEIKDEIRFARELLPMYYKHNNMASFIRQLNMYGFHKLVSPDAGSMKLETPDEIRFMHPFFRRGQPYLVENIKRKIGVSKVVPGQAAEKPQVINKVLTDVRQMKGRQDSLDSRLTAMKMENGALWRELSILRQKHAKQQQIVNKLIQFLVGLVQQNHNNTYVKRNFPRMLQHHTKLSQHDDDDLDENNSNANYSPLGPTIHELDPAEAFLETVVEEVNTTPLDSPSEDVNYFFNQSDDHHTVTDGACETYLLDDEEAETIVGVPEDVLFLNKNTQKPNHNSRSSSLFTPKRIKTQNETLNPKYLNAKKILPDNTIILNLKNKKPNQINRPSASIFLPKKSTKQNKTSQPKYYNYLATRGPNTLLDNQQKVQMRQLRVDGSRPVGNNQQVVIDLSQPENKRKRLCVNKNLQQQLPKKNQQLLKMNQEQIKKNQYQTFLKSRQHEVIANQQLASSQQQPSVLQQSPQTEPIPVITIPFDSGLSGAVVSEVAASPVKPLYSEGSSDNFILPTVNSVHPTTSTSPDAQPKSSPIPVSPQDFMSSPLIQHDPVMTPQCPTVASPLPVVTSPVSNSDMQVACVEESQATSPNQITRSADLLTEMDSHVDSVQSDLDSLRELLRSEGISLDANTLLGYFNDDPLSYNISDPMSGVNADQSKENNGNELMAYSPSLFDLTDLMGSDWTLPTSPEAQVPSDDTIAEVNTPQFIAHSPTFPTPAKKRKK